MGVGIEWLGRVDAGILRLGHAFDSYGDPYDFACTVVRDGDTLTFSGASSMVLASIIKERNKLKELLLPLGIRRVQWQRILDGKVRIISIRIQ